MMMIIIRDRCQGVRHPFAKTKKSVKLFIPGINASFAEMPSRPLLAYNQSLTCCDTTKSNHTT